MPPRQDGPDDSMIGQSASRLFAENVGRDLLERTEDGVFPAALWRLVADGGFAHALAREAAGGIGASWHEAWPILRGIGYWQVPLPLAETMVASLLLSLAGLEVPSGPIALLDADVAAPVGGRVDARVDRVGWARHCPSLLCCTADGELLLVANGGADGSARGGGSGGVSVVQASNHAGLPSDTVRLDGAPVSARAPNPLPSLRRPIRHLGALVRSAMIVGALERVLEESVRYANDRVQFGKPIGKYQAIQQSLAMLAGEVSSARVAALVATIDAPSDPAADASAAGFGIAVAKVRCGEAATRAAAIAHQVIGAIGFTREHPLHFATRRLWAWRAEFGTDAWWAEQLGRGAIATGPAGFWPAITARRFDPALPASGSAAASTSASISAPAPASARTTR
ncbi:MAG: acyl-CoA dehydrogenase family protein [Lautropia sp.]